MSASSAAAVAARSARSKTSAGCTGAPDRRAQSAAVSPAAAAFRTACVTNKDHTDAAPMLQKFFGERISHVEGRKPGRPTKPAPDAVYDALKALGADPSRALYVGDSGVDSETAKNASLPCVLCDWGYWDRDRLENCAALGIISAPAELLQYV